MNTLRNRFALTFGRVGRVGCVGLVAGVAGLTFLLGMTGCTNMKNEMTPALEPEPGIERAYFAGGCFWCVEAVFESIRGVKESISGYSGGHTENPTYESSNTGKTGHAEAVEIHYDPTKVSFKELVEAFFASHDPTQINGQGPDKGSQYRAIAFYQNDEEKKVIDDLVAHLNETKYDGKIVTEVTAFEKFWPGEAYHQNYERLHPENPYIQAVSIPRLKRFQAARPDLLKSEDEQSQEQP